VYLVDGLDGVQVIDSRVKSDFVQDDDASLLHLGFEFFHCRRDVAGGHNVLLVLDGGFDHIRVMNVGHEGNDQVVRRDLGIESFE
jgi:hypothetical protein